MYPTTPRCARVGASDRAPAARAAFALATLAATLTLPLPAQALEVNTLPTDNTPGGSWTEIVFAGTSMVTGSSSVTLSTAPYRGVWFGNGSNYGDTPNWSLSPNAVGNSLSLTASFSSNAYDWSAYLLDGTHEAAIIFRPSGCDDSCYNTPAYQSPAFPGIEVYYRNALGQSVFERFFVDTTAAHTYSFLLKDGRVSYSLDGTDLFVGNAMQVPYAGQLLVIGDGSGSTGTGQGSMTVSAVSFNNAPTADVPASPVPEPSGWVLALAGVGLVVQRVGPALRRVRLSI